MCSMPSTRRPRLCTIWTAVAPEAVFTRRTKVPTTRDYRRSRTAFSDHIGANPPTNAHVNGTHDHKIARTLQLRSGHCLTTSDHPIRTGRSRTSVSRSRPSRVNGGLDRRRQAEPLIICGRRPAAPWLPRIRHRHRQTTSLTRSDQRCLDLDSQKDHCWIIVGVLVAGIGAPLAGFRGLLDLLPTP